MNLRPLFGHKQHCVLTKQLGATLRNFTLKYVILYTIKMLQKKTLIFCLIEFTNTEKCKANDVFFFASNRFKKLVFPLTRMFKSMYLKTHLFTVLHIEGLIQKLETTPTSFQVLNQNSTYIQMTTLLISINAM